MATDNKIGGSLTELIPYGGPKVTVRPAQSSNNWDWESGTANAISLLQAWHVLVKRRWTILTTTVVVLTIATIASFRMDPIYRASARVAVEADSSQIQSINDLYQKSATDDAYVQTQLQVLKSENLAWRTIQQLRMDENRGFIAKPADLPPPGSDDRKYELVHRFGKALSVELIPKTRMLVVSFESTDPKLASEVATAQVNNYADSNFREKYSATRQASRWMEQQLEDLKIKVEQSQQALVDYERRFALAQTGEKGEKQTVSEQVLSDLSKEFTNAQSERIQREAKYNRVLSNRDEVIQLADNDLLSRLKEKHAELKNQYVEALASYGPNFPKVQRLRQQCDEQERQVASEQTRVVERVREEFQAAQNRERLALQAVTKQKEELARVNDLLVQHNILRREFETNQQMYQTLLQRLKDATLSAGLHSTNIHIVDTAMPPAKPIRPRHGLNIAMGLLGGLVIGVMFAFGSEALDQSIKSMEDVEAITGFPALGAIPKTYSESKVAVIAKGPADVVRRDEDVTAIERARYGVAEAFRSLRTSILLSLVNEPPKLVLVTSSSPGEGKTTTALNLAHVMAQRKGPVLLVDCDLRKMGVATVLGLSNSVGISTLLTGQHDLDSALQQCCHSPDLWVLPSGAVPPNPAELLSSDRMMNLLDELRERFEHVIIDSPPVLAVTDATVLSRAVDGVVLVAESAVTPRGALARTCRILENAGAKILGVALNKIDLRVERYYGGNYGSYYHQYYGESERTPQNRH